VGATVFIEDISLNTVWRWDSLFSICLEWGCVRCKKIFRRVDVPTSNWRQVSFFEYSSIYLFQGLRNLILTLIVHSESVMDGILIYAYRSCLFDFSSTKGGYDRVRRECSISSIFSGVFNMSLYTSFNRLNESDLIAKT
jgi:hypothetical protein